MQTKNIPLKFRILLIIRKMLFLTIGAFIAAAAIEGFLLPNNIIDGGVIGISMIASYLTGKNLGLLVVLINFPFICLAFTKMGKKFLAEIIANKTKENLLKELIKLMIMNFINAL